MVVSIRCAGEVGIRHLTGRTSFFTEDGDYGVLPGGRMTRRELFLSVFAPSRKRARVRSKTGSREVNT